MSDVLTLEHQLQHCATDIERVDTLLLLFSAVIYRNPQQAARYATEALVLSERSGYKAGIVQSLLSLGSCCGVQDDFETALPFYLDALERATRLGNERQTAIALRLMGNVYRMTGNYEKSLACSLDAKRRFESLSLWRGVAQCLLTLGAVFSDGLGNVSDALKYHTESLTLARQHGYQDVEAIASVDIGIAFLSLGDYPQALEYVQAALSLSRRIIDRPVEQRALDALGNLYRVLENHPVALEYYAQAVALSEALGGYMLGATLLQLGSLLRETGDTAQAIEVLRRCIDTAEKQATGFILPLAYKELAKACLDLGDRPQAARCSRIARKLERKMFDDKRIAAIRHLVTEIELDRFRRLQPSTPDADALSEPMRRLIEKKFDALPLIANLSRNDDANLSRNDDANLSRSDDADLNRPDVMTPVAPLSRLGTPEIIVKTFGGFRVIVRGKEVSPQMWGRKKVRDLFKLLLIHYEQPVSADRLLEELWGGDSADLSRPEGTLSKAVTYLRTALDAALGNSGSEGGVSSAADKGTSYKSTRFIQQRDRSYTLSLGQDAFIDYVEFKRLIAEADDLRRSQPAPSAESLRLYEQATRLYEGDFLPESVSEQWATDERESLRETVLETYLVMSDLYTKLGKPDEALSAALSTLLHDALFEKGYAAALRLCHHTGKPEEARRIFRKCVDAFQKQLGCPPPNSLSRLAQSGT